MPHSPHAPAARGEDDLRRIHREILSPTFAADELFAEDHFVEACRRGELLLRTTERDGEVVAVAVASRFKDAGVLLLVWLAVRPGVRGGGYGRAILVDALDAWQREVNPRLVLGEVEHPHSAVAAAEHGDPARRLGFYHAFGVRALPLAHLQPAYREGGAVVENLMLCVFRDDGRAPGGSVAAEPVRRFVRGYLAGSPELAERVLAGVDGELLATMPLTLPAEELPNRPRG